MTNTGTAKAKRLRHTRRQRTNLTPPRSAWRSLSPLVHPQDLVQAGCLPEKKTTEGLCREGKEGVLQNWMPFTGLLQLYEGFGMIFVPKGHFSSRNLELFKNLDSVIRVFRLETGAT